MGRIFMHRYIENTDRSYYMNINIKYLVLQQCLLEQFLEYNSAI